MDKINISLTLNEWNIVMTALSHRPFGEVAAVINEINSQASSQLPKNTDQGSIVE